MATVIASLSSKDRVEPVNVRRAFLLWLANPKHDHDLDPLPSSAVTIDVVAAAGSTL